MADRRDVSALARFSTDDRPSTIGLKGLSIREIQAPAQIILRGAELDLKFTAAIETELDLKLPAPGRFTGNDPALLWHTPTEFLLVTSVLDAGGIVRRLNQAFADTHATAIDQSDALVTIDLDGPMLSRLIAKGCGLVQDRALAPGCCVRTLFAQLHVTLYRRPGVDGIRLNCDRAQSVYLWSWLLNAAELMASG
jgi:heterotetrameric sarcosine oxidase gamma subunit